MKRKEDGGKFPGGVRHRGLYPSAKCHPQLQAQLTADDDEQEELKEEHCRLGLAKTQRLEGYFLCFSLTFLLSLSPFFWFFVGICEKERVLIR